MATGARLRVDVLGPLRVADADGRDLTPDGGLQRRLLALLVLRRGQVVSTDSLVDALWPDALPKDPTAALQTHVFRLRRALPPGSLESDGDGYRLDPDALAVDADRLFEIVAGGSEMVEEDLAELSALLARWHGPAYPELDATGEGRAAALLLEEQRVRAREVRAQWRLDRGDLDGLISELQSLVDAEPMRETPRWLLMQALAASGRRVDALRAYDDFRRALGDELGIEPSPVLSALHAALLDGTDGGVSARAHPGWSSSRLPTPATSLVGRDELGDVVVDLLRNRRLVSLVGPGGVGKTQLALEVGRRLRVGHPGPPVVLCELAAADVRSAAGAVAAVLEIEARPGMPIADRVTSVVGERAMALILDNCEHVLEPVADLADRFVRHCPNVMVLATSRERLRVPGEHVVVVPPLASDDGGSPAVTLFVERARAVRPSFAPGPEDRDVIAGIATRLDGLPLAIELAAARLHTHDLAEIADGLDDRFSLLSAGSRVSPRHASLGAALSWSYELLDEQLRRVFRELSIFVGSFTVADAAAVCAADVSATAAALTQLTERSLLQRTADRRYAMLETLREFGAERLRAESTAEADLVADRHARHMVEWAGRADGRLSEPGATAIVDIDAAIPELRAALVHLLRTRQQEPAGNLLASLLHYCFLRLRPDVLDWSRDVIAGSPDDGSASVPNAWVAATYAAWMVGDIDAARRASERALQSAGERGTTSSPKVATACGTVALLDGRFADSIEWYERAVDAAADDRPQRLFSAASELLPRGYSGDPSAADRAARLLAEIGDAETPQAAYLWYCAGETVLATDVDLARARLARAIEIGERTAASFVTGAAGASKASLDARSGDPAAVAADYRWLLDHWRRAGVWSTQWTMLRSVASLLVRLGRHRDAAVLVGAVTTPRSGHRVFGADEAVLTQLGDELRTVLGDDAYAAAVAVGGALDGDAAVEHARRALRPVDGSTEISPGASRT